MSDIANDQLTILVVDDEEDNLELLERTLGVDYDVRRASSGEEAIELIPELENLALIITDQKMPGLRGTELLSRARVLRSDAVRIILTGYTDPVDLIEAINSSHVYRYLTKPWDVDHLCSVVRRAMRLYEAGGGDWVDEATGLRNRGVLTREIGREIARAGRTEKRLVVEAVELVGYDDYSKSAGQVVSEQLLLDVATELGSTIRAMDIIGVYGPARFVVLLPYCSDGNVPAPRLREAAEAAPAFLEAQKAGASLSVTVSDAKYPDDGKTALDLFKALGLAN